MPYALMTDGYRVVSGAFDGKLKVFDLISGQVLAAISGPPVPVSACTVTTNARSLVSGLGDGTLNVWDLESGRTRPPLRGHANSVTACAVFLNDRRVLSASEDKTLKAWDLETGRVLATLQGHYDWVTACAISPDGQYVVSGSKDQTLKIWDLATGRALATLEGHTDRVTACAVTPDGRHVVSASNDQTLKIWDLATYTCRMTHRGDAGYRAIAVSVTTVIAGDAAGAVWFLDLPRSVASSIDATPRALEPPTSDASPSPRVLGSPVTTNTILFMAANPTGTDMRALAEQARAIQSELERAGHRDRFAFETRWAAQPLDLLRDMVKLKPTVVHFCGGRLAGGAGAAPPAGVSFQGSDRRAQMVFGKALAQAFASVGSVKLVVLDACYSDDHADSIATHIDCVVGMAGGTVDSAATSFSIGLYGGLGEGESVAAAFKQGCAAIGMTNTGDPDQPRLRVRPGVDASRLVLANPR